jgi:hypothetical protein
VLSAEPIALLGRPHPQRREAPAFLALDLHPLEQESEPIALARPKVHRLCRRVAQVCDQRVQTFVPFRFKDRCEPPPVEGMGLNLRVQDQHRGAPWPKLLDFWGLPNLQVINRDVHAAKCAVETRDRRAARFLETELA